MKIERLSFDDITTQPQMFSFSRESLQMQGGFGKAETILVTSELTLQKQNKHVFISGFLEVDYIGVCTRCGGDAPVQFAKDFQYYVFSGKEPENFCLEQECPEDDVEKLYIEDSQINIQEILYEQVYLNMPMQNVCDPSCKGRCAVCGVDLNYEKCHCEDERLHSPFAVLGKLKQYHKSKK